MEIEESQYLNKNMTHVSFRDTGFLYYNPLNEANVMDYFYLSPFYEKNSINHICNVQKLDFKSQKTKMIGIEFNLDFVSKDKELYYISKNYREKSTSTLLSYYYVFKGTIFQAPDLNSLLLSNVETLSHNFTNILNTINNEKN